jgi:uncharacterized protein (DUF1778 family)
MPREAYDAWLNLRLTAEQRRIIEAAARTTALSLTDATRDALVAWARRRLASLVDADGPASTAV